MSNLVTYKLPSKYRKNSIFTGIGSRKAPQVILEKITLIASFLESHGLKLRSGGAKGSDKAFERGIKNPDNKEIWLFDNNLDDLKARTFVTLTTPHEEINWAWIKAISRNMYQVFGETLDDPVDFVVYWDKPSMGGTKYAVNAAKEVGIPTFNLRNELDDFREFLKGYLELEGESNELQNQG